MSDLSPAANAISLAQWAFVLVGVALVAAWFFAPSLRAVRTTASRMPAWDAPLGDTLLVAWVAVCAVFVGSLLAGSLSRQFALDPAGGWMSVLSVLGFQGAVTATLALFALYRRSFGRALPPVGATPALPLPDRVLLGAAVFCAALPPVYGTSFLSGKVMEMLELPVKLQDLAGFFTAAHSPALVFALALMGVVIAPLAEELVFRAGLYRVARRALPRWAALLVSALAFASLHGSAVHFVPLTVLGMIFALAYERTGSLLVPVVAHGLFNLNSILLLLAGVGGAP
ncbi:MAG: CPBP family intramembrane metalloprotease [Opitutaceae bacterium]